MSFQDLKPVHISQFLPRRIKRFCQRIVLSFLLIGILAACQTATIEPPSSSQSAIATRPVEDAMGVTEVPVNPQRVIVLDTAPLDAAIALGITPVGALIGETLPAYLGVGGASPTENRTDRIVTLGSDDQPNLEKIALLQPDLILGSKVVGETIYPQLSQIAPTVLTEETGRDGNWPANLRLYAEALNKVQQAEQLLADYKQQVTDIQQQIGNPSDIVISVVFSYQNHIGFYSDTSFSGSVLSDLGLSRPPIQTRPETAPHLSIVSKEAFNDLDGDLIFLLVGSSDDQLSFEDFINDPLYSQLSAVQHGRVHPVQTEVWTAGRNILAARQILQDIEKALVE